MERLKFVLVPIGSAGDVHPFIWLGKLLAARGHEVVMVAQAGVAEMPQRAGLTTVAWGDAQEQEAIIRNPDIWHPRRALDLITSYSAKWAAENMAVIEGQIQPGRTVVMCGALAFGARVLREAMAAQAGGSARVPLITVHVQPSIFMSLTDTPVMIAKGEWLPGLPRFLKRWFFGIANWTVDRKLGPAIDAIRHAQGLSGKTRGLMRCYWHSPDGVLCLFPDWFSPKQADWPPQAQTSRFPLYDEAGDRPRDAALEAFFAADTSAAGAPVIITPGSANAHGAHFIREAVAGAARAGRRSLVITRFPEQVGPLPAGSACFAYAPFSEVFPHGAAIVHHGGIGTTAQCLAAGVPQLIMPMAHDQPDNANRIQRMGVGEYIYPRRFKAPRIAEALARLTSSDVTRRACGALQSKMAEQMSSHAVGDLIEAMTKCGC